MSDIVDAYSSHPKKGYPKINLDHVARFKPSGSGDYECFTAEGVSLGTISRHDIPEPSSVVAETRGTMLVHFWLHDGKLKHVRYPVLAWRIEPGDEYGQPICCTSYDEDGVNVAWCLETEGIWIFPGDRDCDTLEDATAYALKEIEGREKHGGKLQEPAVAAAPSPQDGSRP